jgi:hypothetical protein
MASSKPKLATSLDETLRVGFLQKTQKTFQ